MHDQAARGQIIVMTESVGAQRKQKPGDKVTARVLFDGTHGLCVNSKTRLRDQERAPIAADFKRSMREKSRIGELTFTLSADVTEAHRQVPIHPDDWHLLGCQVSPGGDVFVNTVGTFGIASASYYWSRVAAAVGRLVRTTFIFRVVCSCRRAFIVAQDLRRRHTCLGRFRIVAALSLCWNFGKKS